MARKLTGRPNGRPPTQIDWQEFDKLAALQCTLKEFACFFGCSEDAIERAVKRSFGVTFAEHFDQKRQKGFISLRRQMYQRAQNGNTTMQIWLSKNYLGYTDKVSQDLKHSGSIDVPTRTRAIQGIFADERSRELALELAERMIAPKKAEGDGNG